MTFGTLLFQWFQHPFFKLIPLFLLAYQILLRLINRRSRSEKLNLPPSPPKLPIVGNLHQLGMILHQSLHQLSEKYGPLILLHLGYAPTLVVSSAEMFGAMKMDHDIPFSNRPFTTATNILLYGFISLTFTPYSEHWRRVRKIVVMELLNIKKVQSFKYVREEEVALMMEKIFHSFRAGNSVNISELGLGLSNDIVCRCVLGRKPGAKDGKNKVGELVGEVSKLLAAFSFGDLFPCLGWMDVLTGLTWRIKNLFRELDNFFDQIIDEHDLIQNSPDLNKDFVDILLQVQKDDTNFTRENIKALLMDSFLAGTETTSTTIEWAMAELVKNPNVMKKAQEEVRRVVGKNNKVKEEDIHEMVYLKSVVKEVLRLHPPVALSVMESSTITEVNGFHIPAKTRVLVNIWSIQRDPKSWETPLEFAPERFSNSSLDFKGQDFIYIPFGSGRRGCPGISFGIIVVEFAIANLLYWFDWEAPGGKEIDMTEEGHGFALGRKIPLHLAPLPYFT